ncbi:unnamed protein product [Tilletia laevis]|uniref:Uncharacterized protein n=2 Tax=Tilletia TaxID=13289 RepID=A0A8T8SJN4_9BASI|nr:hypothetical protein CF335_g6818 [Tilletia laevis]KAE8241207.1 hypothetical protein A4X03_0g8194 [Tilletia caries]CAD6921305.1 unnamed protein product [Tilletia caries]CAD6922349.1 unnamed protein product [Tilletia laevis]CAD6941673.1 unnamed protein product [Tilletia caries]
MPPLMRTHINGKPPKKQSQIDIEAARRTAFQDKDEEAWTGTNPGDTADNLIIVSEPGDCRENPVVISDDEM